MGTQRIDPDRELTLQQLADRIGPRRAGRPTLAKTVHAWVTLGLRGVRLEARQDTWRWWTTWGAYERFLCALDRQRREGRRERLRAVEAVLPSRRARLRAERAMKELERLGAL